MSATTIQKSANKGPLYAALLAAAWLGVHLYAVFGHAIGDPWWMTAALILVQIWLYTGLFIVAHDTMHGSFAPNNPRLNDWTGRIILFWYAGFNWDSMRTAHHQHHATPGTEDDPDFNADNPHAFWPWYFRFFVRYFSWKQIVVLAAIVAGVGLAKDNTAAVIGAMVVAPLLGPNMAIALGIVLTHRHGEDFADEHLARTNDYPRWLSLLTCFHFGYHHEHHLYPHEPWWRLPARKFELSS